MSTMLLLVTLVGISAAQQAQLVYDKHFVDTPQQPQQLHQAHYANQQNYAPHPVPQQPQSPWPQHPTNQHPNIAMFPPQVQQSPAQTQFQHNYPSQHHHHHPSMGQYQIGLPSEHFQPMGAFQPHASTQASQSVPYHPNGHRVPIGPQSPPHGPHPHHHQTGPPQSLPPGAVPIPMGTEFANRRGPLDNMIKGAKHYFPGGSGKKRRPGTPIRFMEMNRLPKPPKYPLYDMPDLGMATPPPPPLMHPMSVAASNLLASYTQPSQHPQRGGRAPPRGKKPPPRRPPPPQMPRRPTRPGQSRQGPSQHGQRSHRRPPPHGKHNPLSHGMTGYEHNMASNLDPQVSSPPLGRPLNFDEYMKRPSHSFTDDPWNFDPFAANYNSGMNTFAMKYNYDPLGMNSLDKTQSHLDPEQLSYPGDYHNLQDGNLNVGKVTQLGGWDKSPDTYRTTSLTPPPRKTLSSNNGNYNQDLNGVRRHEKLQQHSPNSFNLYDQSDSSSVVKAESLNLNPLKILSDANPGIEFTIESSSNGDGVGDTYKGGSTNYETQAQYKDYPAWNSYSQSAHDVYDGLDPMDTMSSHQVNNYGKTLQSQDYLKQLQSSSKYENGNYDPQTQLHTFALSQDYVPRERPLSDLSDNYNPHGDGGLSTDLTPPGQTSAMFKRQGSRLVRQEKTPMIELEGLSLFKDILKNDRAKTTRSELIRVLTN